MVYTIPAKRNERAQSTDRVFYPSGGYGRTTFKVFISIGFLVWPGFFKARQRPECSPRTAGFGGAQPPSSLDRMD